MAHICVVRQLYFLQDPACRREVDALLEAGHQVDVVCLRRYGERFRDKYGAATVWRLPIQHRRGSLLLYFVEYGLVLLLAAILLAVLQLHRRFDIVQVNSPPDSLVFAALAPKLLGARVLLQLKEPLPEFFAAKFGRSPESALGKLVARTEQLSIRFSDFALTCTAHMRQAFVDRGASPEKIGVVLPSSDETKFDPSKYRGSLGAPGTFILLSHGSIEERYGLDTVIRAVAVLRLAVPGLAFRIYGEGSDTDRLRALAAELQVADRVSFEGWVPLPDLLQAIADCNAGVVAMKKDPFRDLTHCNKMYDFIAMRRPALVSRTASVEDYFDDDAFEKFTAGDEHDLARAIRRLVADRPRRDELIRHAALQNEPYRWPHQKRYYLGVIADLSAGRSPFGPSGADTRPRS